MALIEDMSMAIILPKLRGQTQMEAYISPNTQLFRYFDAHMVAIKHLHFSFGEKVDFVNYSQ